MKNKFSILFVCIIWTPHAYSKNMGDNTPRNENAFYSKIVDCNNPVNQLRQAAATQLVVECSTSESKRKINAYADKMKTIYPAASRIKLLQAGYLVCLRSVADRYVGQTLTGDMIPAGLEKAIMNCKQGK